MRKLPVAILSTAVVLGCSGSTPAERSNPNVEAQTEPSTEVEADVEGEGPSSDTPAARACEDIQQQFRHAMARATGRCSADTDCGCFNPVVGEAGCGGITDRATADALSEIEHAFHAARCPWPHQCGPWRCEPVCRDGRCVNSQPGGRLLP
ncbi:MAG TPA: hypothetical protein VIL20_23625 [Sandaracinaceae bacterium]